MANTWVNSNGVTFELKPVHPFLEDEIKQVIKWPDAPYYATTSLDVDGKEVRQIYQHTDETMTEVDDTPDKTPVNERCSWLVNGKLVRWSPDATRDERRAWKAYKAAEAKATNEFTNAFVMAMFNNGLVIPSDYDTDDKKKNYIMGTVITSEADSQSLFVAIQRLRKINPERLALIEASFPNKSQ